MSEGWIAFGLGVAGALLLALLGSKRDPPRLLRENYRGEAVPVHLGLPVLFGAVIGSMASSEVFIDGWIVVAMFLVSIAGHLDDRSEGRERGFRGHLGSLRRLRPTTGILKIVVGVGGAIWVGILLGGGPFRITLSALTIALCTNLWNALDVRPGRALKWGILALIPVAAATSNMPFAGVTAGALGGSAAALPFDLTERGMLGDEGSNPLGFAVGVGFSVVLPTPGLIAAAIVAVLLQVAAETVTISRLIDAVPPLRWFDRLGRRPEGEPAPS